MFCQETGDVIWGHIDRTLASGGGIVAVSGFATFGTVRYFLVTDTGLVSSDFAIETLVFIHKLFLFGIRMHLSHSTG